MKKAFLLIGIGIVMVLLPYPILSQWTNDTQINTPVCIDGGIQYQPKIVSDGAGGVIIIWTDNRSGNSAVYAQKLNSSGVAQWTENGTSICSPAIVPAYPQIISDGAGGAIITWTDNRSGNSAVYAQKLNSSGVAQWTENGVAVCAATSYQYQPKITSDGSAGAIITWTDNRSGNSDVYAQKLNSDGAVQWTENGAAVCTAASGQDSPQIISDGSSGAIITWYDYRNGNYDVYAQRLNSNGAVQWAVNGTAICLAANHQMFPQITSDGYGGAVIAWEDYRNEGATGIDIYAQRINSNGSALWTANGEAVCSSAGDQRDPSIANDGYGGAFITWGDNRSGNSDIYAQRVNSSGTALWTANGITICDAANWQFSPQITSDGSGGAIITWQDNRSGTSDIYAQRVNSLGTTLWTANGITICDATNNIESPQIMSDGSGGAIITWGDYRNGNIDIYAQYTGVLVAPSPSDSDGDGVDDSDENAGPNYGDANGDFFRDADQAHIVPIVSWDGSNYCVVDGGQGGTSFTPKNIESEGPGVPFDKGMKIFPLGMTSFRLEGSEGFSKVVRIYYFTNISLSNIEGFKWYCKSAPDYDKYEWHEIPADNGSYGIVATGEGDAGGSHYIYVDVRLTDNAFGDSNPIAGIIDDPIAPYYSGAVVPSIGEFGGVALILSLLTLGGWIIIRRIV